MVKAFAGKYKSELSVMNSGEHWVHTKSQISHLKMLLQYELNQTLMLDLLISDSKFNGKEKDELIIFF